jgi:selenocysteine lyase/cysteine desulfurase
MSVVAEAGVPAIEAHVSELNTVLIGRLEEIGATVVTPADPALRGPLICVRSVDVVRLCDELLEDRIVCSHRDDNLRISAHLYNTVGDVERIVDALAARRHLLA